MAKLSSDWDNISALGIYGYGRKAVRMVEFIHNDFAIEFVIDNNPELTGKYVCGVPIVTFSDIKANLTKHKILVTVGGVSYYSIKQSLESIGLVEDVDFCSYETFFVDWYWRNKGKVIMSECYITITSRCTFRCKHCDQLMPYYNKDTHWESSIVEIDNTLSAFFTKADYLVSFFIVGGEPLLYRKLPDLLEMICTKYRDKIGYIQIITNGSIIPDERTIETIKKYSLDIRLSDYTCSINYKEKLNELMHMLKSNGISYSMSKYEKWYDVGIPGKEKEQFFTKKEIRQHAIDCAPCHVIADKKFYYCGSYYNSVKCGFIDESEDAYVDLTEETTLDNKRKLLTYSRGEVGEGYLNVCNRCYGKSGKDLREVEPAIQMERNA